MAIYDPNSNQHSSNDTVASFTPKEKQLVQEYKKPIVKKVTIELTEVEYDGIKKYLFDQNGEKASVSQVKEHVQNIISGYINASQNAESNYITQQKG